MQNYESSTMQNKKNLRKRQMNKNNIKYLRNDITVSSLVAIFFWQKIWHLSFASSYLDVW